MPDPPTTQPPRRDHGADRDARRQARQDARGSRVQRPEVRTRDARRGAPGIRVAASVGVVAIAVLIAVLMGSQDAPAWLVGLVASLVTVALLWSSHRL